MSPRVIQFGEDSCYRRVVLREAGFEVSSCSTLAGLRQALEDRSDLDAICITETSEPMLEKALQLTRECSSAPVVLFYLSGYEYEQAAVALVVQSLTHPGLWLQEIRSLILAGSMIEKACCP